VLPAARRWQAQSGSVAAGRASDTARERHLPVASTFERSWLKAGWQASVGAGSGARPRLDAVSGGAGANRRGPKHDLLASTRHIPRNGIWRKDLEPEWRPEKKSTICSGPFLVFWKVWLNQLKGKMQLHKSNETKGRSGQAVDAEAKVQSPRPKVRLDSKENPG